MDPPPRPSGSDLFLVATLPVTNPGEVVFNAPKLFIIVVRARRGVKNMTDRMFFFDEMRVYRMRV